MAVSSTAFCRTFLLRGSKALCCPCRLPFYSLFVARAWCLFRVSSRSKASVRCVILKLISRNPHSLSHQTFLTIGYGQWRYSCKRHQLKPAHLWVSRCSMYTRVVMRVFHTGVYSPDGIFTQIVIIIELGWVRLPNKYGNMIRWEEWCLWLSISPLSSSELVTECHCRLCFTLFAGSV